MVKRIVLNVALAAVLLAGAFLVLPFVMKESDQTRLVVGSSMSPTLKDGEIVSVEAITSIRRFDIVIYESPVSEPKEFIGRVVGLPSERLEVRDGAVWIENRRLSEPHIADTPLYSDGPITITAEHYYILGDNRNESADSHVWGPVSKATIISRLVK